MFFSPTLRGGTRVTGGNEQPGQDLCTPARCQEAPRTQPSFEAAGGRGSWGSADNGALPWMGSSGGVTSASWGRHPDLQPTRRPSCGSWWGQGGRRSGQCKVCPAVGEAGLCIAVATSAAAWVLHLPGGVAHHGAWRCAQEAPRWVPRPSGGMGKGHPQSGDTELALGSCRVGRWPGGLGCQAAAGQPQQEEE